ncbi:MAG TPA: toprim domain-containing protein [Bacillota bacterium]|nr:toprim domain-containing protein [Bacillota bacterium]
MHYKKIIIVEGKSDRQQIKRVIDEEVDIICTYGTFSISYFDELLDRYDLDHRDVYIFVDEDDSGLELRKELARELPHAHHIRVSSDYKEVEIAPLDEIAYALLSQNIAVDSRFL